MLGKTRRALHWPAALTAQKTGGVSLIVFVLRKGDFQQCS